MLTLSVGRKGRESLSELENYGKLHKSSRKPHNVLTPRRTPAAWPLRNDMATASSPFSIKSASFKDQSTLYRHAKTALVSLECIQNETFESCWYLCQPPAVGPPSSDFTTTLRSILFLLASKDLLKNRRTDSLRALPALDLSDVMLETLLARYLQKFLKALGGDA